MSSVVEQGSPQTTVDRYLAAFEAMKDRRPAGPRWLNAIREAAIQRFAALGIPTTRDEDYRFTNVGPIARTAFERTADTVRVDPLAVAPHLYGARLAAELVFVNGRFNPLLGTVPLTESRGAPYGPHGHNAWRARRVAIG